MSFFFVVYIVDITAFSLNKISNVYGLWFMVSELLLFFMRFERLYTKKL